MIPRRGLILACAVLVALPAAAGWWEVYRADQDFNLGEARRLALATVAADPLSVDAVAAALWWLNNSEHLPDPGEILIVDGGARDPELGFLMARIEAEAHGRAPEGSLVPVELAGPFGVFPSLDLERMVVPADADLPPLGTPWSWSWEPYRVVIEAGDGSVSAPESMSAGGVTLAAWTFEVVGRVDGWMVIEAVGNLDVSLDGRQLARLRRCGEVDPEVSWFRMTLEPGPHRLRIAMGSRVRSRVRVNILDRDGRPVDATVTPGGQGPWALSSATAELPPAAAALVGRLDEAGGPVAELLLAAELAAGRGDPRQQLRWIEQARQTAPSDPWPRLALGWFYLREPTGLDAETSSRRAREELRHVGSVPAAKLAERALALRENRAEDVERILDEALALGADDVRVRQLWVFEAIRRGWAGEVEDGIDKLTAALPESAGVVNLRLEALEALDRWGDRQELLTAVAGADPVRLQWIEELADGCLAGEAVAAMDRLDGWIEDPDMDVAMIRFLIASGAIERARDRLDLAGRRWGDLPALDQLRLVVEAADPVALNLALDDALRRDPSDLQLRTLAWRRGREPFFEPFRVQLDDVLEDVEPEGLEVDVVLLLDQAVERVFPDGSAMYYYHGVSRAITPVGARQASRLQQMPDAYQLKIRIVKPDGRVVVPAQMESRNGTVVLGDVAPGDLVEEEYVASVRATGASRRGHMSPYIYRFADEDRDFGLSEYLLLVPPEVDLEVDGNLEGVDREEWDHHGLRAIRWRTVGMSAVHSEPFSPPSQELLPWVSYSFGVTWQDVGDTLRDRLLWVLGTSAELVEWGVPLVDDLDPDAAVRTLVDRLFEEVAQGRRPLDLSTTAAESFSRREGGRLTILAAVLAEAGWDVDLVMARPRPLARRHLSVPTLETFIEPLLRVRRGPDVVWVDLAEQEQGVGRIRQILQRGDGLVVPLTRPDAAVSLMTELPEFDNPEFRQRVRVQATLSASGDARVVFDMPLTGEEGARLVEHVNSVPADRVAQSYQQMADNLFPGATQVEGSVTTTDEGSTLRLEMSLPAACDRTDDRMVCRSLVVSRPLVPSLASLPQRRFPLALELPITEKVELALRVPSGWFLDWAPRRLETTWGSVNETLESEGDLYRSALVLRVPARTVAPEDYPGFARFCQAVDELMSRPPTLRRAGP